MFASVIAKARRRMVMNRVLAELAVLAAIYSALFALLLIVGTRWLSWPIVLAVIAAGAGPEIFRLLKSTPTAYDAAVELDRRAALQDALSTALHFENSHSAFAAAQRQAADGRVNAVDVSAAMPFSVPRSAYWLAAALLAAAVLLGVRYGRLGTLNLQAPITEVFFEDQAAKGMRKTAESPQDQERRQRLENAEALLNKLGVPVNPEDAGNPEAMEKAVDQALQQPSGNIAAKGEKGQAGSKAMEQTPGADPIDGKQNPAEEKAAADKQSAGKDTPGDKGGPKSASGGDNASLLSKLKEAVSNMLSKASSKSEAGEKQAGQQQASNSKAEKTKGDKGSSSKNQDSKEGADAQDGEPNGDTQEGQQAQGKAASKSAQQSAQAGSGMGAQDGLKELRAAEQLKAMGKLSQIIGKRSETVTGDTTVEVQSGNQQLRTVYSKTNANHSEADSDVARDEIPIAVQPYVQKYFEQIRKKTP